MLPRRSTSIVRYEPMLIDHTTDLLSALRRVLKEVRALLRADRRAESRSLVFGCIERTHYRRDILAR
jgi:hypothetical protein